ncbi:NAG2 [Candida pseudojiufengensis]|uniref:NAG2 n=1 Tax=Candida pseudojiufengensis TaxID=497109 RepID=UPI00222503D0|nr:NAG2 [Candida pseudojiufengensis]KAI5961440.1 NAG2 [Candida pseudojiufengensis]
MSSITRFTNCHLIDNGKLYQNTDLYVDNNTQKIIAKPSNLNQYEITVIDLKGEILAPGFIDIQNNGIYGLNFSNLNSNSTEEDIKEFKRFYKDAMKKYLSTGVTSLCPTVTSNFPDVYTKVLPIYKKSRLNNQCDSLGAHLEGPFINKEKKGCHPIETFVDANPKDKSPESKLLEIYGGEKNLIDNVCIITAAPEIPGILDLIPIITKKLNLIYSIGHTMTDYNIGLQAIDNGCTMITHLYNAMPQPHHRDAGVVGLINTPEVSSERNLPYFGLICDGVHVNPSMVNLAYKSNPNKCVLVTDAMHLIGLSNGSYKWDNQIIIKEDDRLYLKGTQTLAGALTTLPQCIRNLMKWSNISLQEAIKTCTNNAADSIGLSSEKGFLNIGCDADFVILNHKGFVTKIFKLGKEFKSSDINYDIDYPIYVENGNKNNNDKGVSSDRISAVL